MEGQSSNGNSLQFISLDFGVNTCDALQPCQGKPNQQYATIEENCFSEIQRDVLYNNPGVLPGYEPANSTTGMDIWKVDDNAVLQEVKYLTSQHEQGAMNNFTSTECRISFQKQELNEPHSRVAVVAPTSTTKKRDPISRQRATSADRARRVKIAERLNALQELLPHPKQGSKASQYDNIIDHIKYLQLQIKKKTGWRSFILQDLSQSRLGGEPTSGHFICLEGYGHYLLDEQVLNEPLEEMMGKLLEVNPTAASKLLESRGLVIIPMASAIGLNHRSA
ncbi:hypothetical protein NMG60_11013960 [Bertholletia excelsa]